MAKTKAQISFAVTAKLICAFVFAYAKSRFSHDGAHIFAVNHSKRFYHREMLPKDTDGVANRVDLYQLAPLGILHYRLV